MATARSAMSTMSIIKTDSRAQVRLFRCNGLAPPMSRIERLLEAQSRRVIVIIIAMPTEQPVARFFVTCNRSCVVLVDFETHLPAAAVPRRLFGRREQKRADPAPADMGSNSDRVKPSDRGTRTIKHQRIAGERPVLIRNDQRGIRRSKEMAKTSPR